MLRGITAEDFAEAMKVAEESGNKEVIAALNTARDIVELYCFKGIVGVPDMVSRLSQAGEKTRTLQILGTRVTEG